MKIFLKFAVLVAAAVLVFVADYSPQSSRLPVGFQLMSDAHAIAGRQRRTRRRGAAVGYEAGASSAHAQDAAAAEQQQPATTAEQPATTEQAATTAQPAAAAPPVYGPLPQGTVVQALPDGCTTEASGGVEYYHCGDNYFRAAFQSNTLVYVTADPGQSQ